MSSYYERNKDKILEKKRIYREQNREKIREADKLRYKENPEKYCNKSKKYRDENPDKIWDYKEHNKDKRLEQNRQYNKTHSADKQQWYKENRDKVLQRSKEKQIKNRDLINEQERLRNKERTQKLFEILGGKKCIKCNEKREYCLQFDHKNGGGKKEIKKLGSSRQFIKFYVKNPDLARKTLQILCANCNWEKRRINGEHNPTKINYSIIPPID